MEEGDNENLLLRTILTEIRDQRMDLKTMAAKMVDRINFDVLAKQVDNISRENDTNSRFRKTVVAILSWLVGIVSAIVSALITGAKI